MQQHALLAQAQAIAAPRKRQRLHSASPQVAHVIRVLKHLLQHRPALAAQCGCQLCNLGRVRHGVAAAVEQQHGALHRRVAQRTPVRQGQQITGRHCGSERAGCSQLLLCCCWWWRQAMHSKAVHSEAMQQHQARTTWPLAAPPTLPAAGSRAGQRWHQPPRQQQRVQRELRCHRRHHCRCCLWPARAACGPAHTHAHRQGSRASISSPAAAVGTRVHSLQQAGCCCCATRCFCFASPPHHW